LFLQPAGAKNCVKCKETICGYCNDILDNGVYCLPCLASESIIKTGTGDKTIAEMRKELVADNFDGAQELSIDEVEDVHEIMMHLKQYHKRADESVLYPLYCTSEMEETTERWQNLAEVDFKGGGSFLAEPDLDQKDIPGIMNVFAELVRFEEGKKTDWQRDHRIYETLPSIFIKFADKSRFDSGFRLLMRCVRHAFDTKTTRLDNKTAMLIKHGDEIGLHIETAIPASMRQNVYKTGIVATANDLLCCKCTCECGSQKEQRIVCVHILAVLYLLTLLLFEALAESMLLEFSACLGAAIWDESKWDENDVQSLKKSI
jgi:hypothetical protein